MATTDPDLSLLGLAVALATALVGPQLALYVGTYGVIALAWLGGVFIGLYRVRGPVSRGFMAGFAAVSFLVTLGLTVPLAEVAADWIVKAAPWASSTGAKGLLFPVAVLIPAIGTSWIDIGRWIWSKRPSFGKETA